MISELHPAISLVTATVRTMYVVPVAVSSSAAKGSQAVGLANRSILVGDQQSKKLMLYPLASPNITPMMAPQAMMRLNAIFLSVGLHCVLVLAKLDILCWSVWTGFPPSFLTRTSSPLYLGMGGS
ncbi:MAG: hypothetical protein GY696_03400 [Gammaproteobacteria bacterium]|nr:hypothetical protein [Gammaproteobacteria bacterium]